MNISSHISATNLHASYQKSDIAQARKADGHEIALQMKEQSFSFSYVSFELQSSSANDTFQKNYDAFQDFLKEIGYEGGPIAELSQEEAAELVSEEGFFGITQTAERIANFVLNGASGNEELLRSGRSGILQGFNKAEEIWGSKLPDISYKTIEKATEMIDMAMHALGFNIIEESV